MFFSILSISEIPRGLHWERWFDVSMVSFFFFLKSQGDTTLYYYILRSILLYRIRYSTICRKIKEEVEKVRCFMHINLINQSTAISNSSKPKKGLTADVGNNWGSEGKEYVFNKVYMVYARWVLSLGNAWDSFTVGWSCRKITPQCIDWVTSVISFFFFVSFFLRSGI